MTLYPILFVVGYLAIGWVFSFLDEYFDQGVGKSMIVIYPAVIVMLIVFGVSSLILWLTEIVSASPAMVADKIKAKRSRKEAK